MDGERILITGGAGFIGSHLVDRLGARNRVTVLDDLSTGSLRKLADAPQTIRLTKASILQPEVLQKAMDGQTLVYHLAAKTSVPESVAKPREYWSTNVEGTVHVLRAAADAGVRRVVFVSSAAVYGDAPEMPKVESMKPAPASPYAMTKMVGEFACEEIRQMKELETVVVRLFNGYGPRQDPRSPYAGVIPKFAAAVVAGRPVDVHGDGDQTRDFVYVADIAEALELAGEKPVDGQVLNVASGRAVSVNDVIAMLSTLVGGRIRVHRKADRPGDIRHSLAEVSKARTLLGFTARTPLQEGLAKTLDALRATSKAAR